MTTPDHRSGKAARPIRHHLRIAAYLLWRGGLIVAGSSALIMGLKRLLTAFDIPEAVIWGLALVGAGFTLFMISVIIEQRRGVGATP